MKILVTGGAGFIGRYVVDKLRIKGHFVKVLDVEKPKSSDIFTMPDVFMEGSVLNKVKINNLIKGMDAVMHLAGILGTSETLAEPTLPAKVNILGSLNVYKACREYGKKCCTITVGNHFMNNTYAITKTAAERFALMFNKEFGTEIAVVRGLNAYGPGQKAKPVRKVIPNFIIPALNQEVITIYGTGNQIMDFIYVEDLAEILCRALLNEHGVYDKIFEAGSGNRTSISYIAEQVKLLAASTSTIEYKPMRPGETKDSVVIANTKTLEPLDFKEFTSLSEGLRNTIEFYRQHLGAY